MFFRKLFFLFFILLFIAALFGMNGRKQSPYQAGYAQGYVAGQQAAGQAEEGGAVVAPPPAPYSPTYYHPGFSFFSFLVKGFVCFIGFMLLMGLLFGHRHGRWHGRHGRRWQKWHHEWHQSGHKPPWFDDDADEPVMKA